MDDMVTLDAYLDHWLELQRTRVQPSTWNEYEGTTRRYLKPRVGDRRLCEITHHDITQLYHDLLTSGGLRGKPLALITVQRIAAVFHKTFEDAVRTDLIEANPCAKATLPRIDLREGPKDLRVWTAEQLRSFLDAERDRPLWPLWVVAAGTGMRRGEILGLRWHDVDPQRRALTVRRALSVATGQARLKVPKTNQARTITIGPAVVHAIELRRAAQEREAANQPPVTQPPDSRSWNLVFTEPDGGHIQPQKVTDTWREAVRDSPYPNIRFHDVRHSHASLLLEAGVSPQVVSARLGHSNIQTTLDIYAEVLPAMDEEAAGRFEAHVWGPKPNEARPDRQLSDSSLKRYLYTDET